MLLGVLAASTSASALLCCCHRLRLLGAGVPGAAVGIFQQREHPSSACRLINQAAAAAAWFFFGLYSFSPFFFSSSLP